MPATPGRSAHRTPGQPGRGGTSARILDAAERMVQARGFACFSYAAVAAELGITKAALHYHFPGKAELGLALIVRYAARFTDTLAAIDSSAGTAVTRLTAYIDFYAGVLNEKKMCLGGMLAAECETLPPPMHAEVVRFFRDSERWLEDVLEQGARENSMRLNASARDTAVMFLSAIEGAMLVARSFGDPARFRVAAAALLGGLTPGDGRTAVPASPTAGR